MTTAFVNSGEFQISAFANGRNKYKKNETNYMHVFLSGEAGNTESYSDNGWLCHGHEKETSRH